MATRALIGYHASHEQHPPERLLENVKLAEQAGFAGAMCSDHLFPFSEAQGHSGFAWSWLGAALQATKLSFGTVTAPGQRYHPVVVAQAAATLCRMFPGRFWWALGSGQAINEHVTGDPWPAKERRRARLLESVEVIRALFRGETVSHDGQIRVREARLYDPPPDPPLLVGAAVSVEAAGWVAGWADALITTARPREQLRKVVQAFRDGGGDGKPMFLQVALSYAATEDAAEGLAWEQWRTNVLPDTDLTTELPLPRLLDGAAAYVRPADTRGALRVSASLEQHADWLAADIELGFERLFLHHVGKAQRPFIDAFADRVLPRFR